MEVEVGFKIKQSKEEAEKILLKNGFIKFWEVEKTHDIYFGKNINFENKKEEEIKQSLIRVRNFETFENLNLIKNLECENVLKLNKKDASKMVNKILENGFKIIFDTQKSDTVFYKGKCWHQLQNIKDIGLLDYVYDEELFNKNYSEKEQFDILKSQMISLGFELEFELGIDKLRTLYFKELKFSINQNGKYKKGKND